MSAQIHYLPNRNWPYAGRTYAPAGFDGRRPVPVYIASSDGADRSRSRAASFQAWPANTKDIVWGCIVIWASLIAGSIVW